MQRILTRLTPIILSGFLTLFGAVACGGDDAGGGNGIPDAGEADASEADGAPPATRTGTLAITDTTITNPDLPAEVSGAVVAMGYIDDQSVTVAPVQGFTTNINNCLITRYNVTDGEEEPTATDEGIITVTGTANGDFACGFNTMVREYVCQSTTEAIRGGVAGNANSGTLDADTDLFLLAGGGFTAEMQGMTIQLSGFGAGADGVYPIVAVPLNNQLQLAGVEVSGEGGENATFTTFVGATPIPNLAAFDFLDDGTETVTISKVASTIVPAIDVDARARGEGFLLTGTQPHEFPATAQDLTFTCADAGCGSEPNNSGLIEAMVVNGVTTDAAVDADDPTNMDYEPVASFATFTCSQIGADSITIPEDAVAQILESSPTRVQVTVGRFVAALEMIANRANTSVVIGHSLTGFTDFAVK